MSDGLLDERIVEMRFDNADFERNVNQSIKTIDKLKESLDFENAGESFENISAAAAKCDMKPLEDSLEGITVKFNMLEMVAANVLGNITSKIVDAGAKLAKSLTTDQLTAGWAKYDQKTAAVQTIISATGASIDEVNQKLEKLIWFADETSYDFVDMVNNIGKFTSAGVDLDTAVDSMMGISNWAAASGAGIQQASRAMYNLSQAIGMGYVGLTDWRSIELANMATKEFKETVIATALDMGTLQQAADGTVKTLSGKFEVTAENMRNSLKEQWFSTDVLNSALAAYNEFANLVHDRQEQWAEENDGAYLTVSRTIKLLEKEGYAMDTLGAKAFMRAQEATKFSEAVAATADAVSSGWMRTFELIFGNYEQAKKLWTDLANDMYDVFASGNERRNEKLADLMHSNYQKMLDEMPDSTEMNNRLYEKLYEMTKTSLGVDKADELFSAYDSIEDMLKSRNNMFYGSNLAKAFSDVADDFSKEAETAANLSKQLKSGSLTLKQAVLRLASGQYGTEIETQRKAVEELGFDFESLQELAEEWKAGLEIPWDAYQKQLVEALDEQEKTYKTFVDRIIDLGSQDGFFSGLTELGGRDKLIGGFQNVIDTFKNVYLTIVEVKNGISDLSGSGSLLGTLIDGFYNLTEAFAFTDEKFEKVQEGIESFFHGGLQKRWNEFLYGKNGTHLGTQWSDALNSYIPYYEHIPGLIDIITSSYQEHIANLPAEVAHAIETVRVKVFGFFNEIPQKIGELREKIFGKFNTKTVIDALTGKRSEIVTHTGGLLNDLKDKFANFGNGLGGKLFDGFTKSLKKIADFLFGYETETGKVEGKIVWIYDKVTAFWQRLKDIGKLLIPVKDFLFGIKDSDRKVVKNNIFGNMGTAVQLLTSSDAYKSVHDFIFGNKDTNTPNIFGKIGSQIQKITETSAYQSIHKFIFGDKETKVPNIFGKISEAFKQIAESSAYQSIHKFIFGDKESKTPNILGKISGLINSIAGSTAFKFIHNFIFGNKEADTPGIFGKIKNAIDSITGSFAFKSIYDFIFGKKANTKGVLGSLSAEGNKLADIFERIKSIIESIRKKLSEWKAIWITGFNKETFDWDIGANVEKVDGKVKQFITNIKNGFTALLSNAGYESFHDFIFGNKQLGIDNVIIRTIEAIKQKLNELKATYPWIQTACDFIKKEIANVQQMVQKAGGGLSGVITAVKNYLFGYDVKKDGLAGLLGQVEHVEGIIDKIKSAIENFKNSIFKKEKKSIFEQIVDTITGPFKVIQKCQKLLDLGLHGFAALGIALLGFNFEGFGVEIHNPLGELVDTIKAFVESLAIVAGVLIGIPALMKIFKISSNELASSVILVGAIMFALVKIADHLNSADDNASLKDALKSAPNVVLTLSALSVLLAEIAAIAIVLAGTRKLLGGHAFWAGVLGIIAIVAAIGTVVGVLIGAIKIGKPDNKKLQSRAGELFGLGLILAMLTPLILSIVVLIAELALVSKLMGKDTGAMKTLGIGFAAVVGTVLEIINAVDKISKKGISKSVIATLGLISLIIGTLGAVITTLAVTAKLFGGIGTMVTAVGALVAPLFLIVRFIDDLSKVKNIGGTVIGTLALMGVITIIIGTVLENLAKTIKKVGGGNAAGAVFSIIGVLAALIGAVWALSQIKINNEALKTFGLMTAIVVVLGGVVLGFAKLADMLGIDFDPKQVLNMILSIGEVVLAIVGLSIIFGLLGKVAEGLNSGFGALAGLIAKTVGIVALVMVLVGIIGGIAKAIDSKLGDGASLDAINYFGDLLESLFNALGKAVGAVIGGFGEGLTDSLPKIGKNISAFMEKFGSFLSQIKDLKEDHLTGAGILTAIIATIVADEFLGKIAALIENFGPDGGMLQVAQSMGTFMSYMKPFLKNISVITEDHVKSAEFLTSVMKELVKQEVLGAIDNIIKYFGGTANYETYTKNLTTISRGIVRMDRILSKVDKQNVSDDVEIIKSILDLVTDSNYKSGGIAGIFDSIINGETDFKGLFDKLNNEIVDGFSTFASKVSGVDVDNAKKASEILPSIMDMLTNKNYRQGGISGFFTDLIKGDAEYDKMFDALNTKILPGLRNFAQGVNALNEQGESIDYSNISLAAEGIKAVMDIMTMDTSNLINDDKNGWWIFKEDQSAADKVGKSFEAITNKVVPAIKTLQTALTDSEVDQDYIRDVVGSFSSLLQTLMEFKDFGIDESKVSEIGGYIITGLIEALDSGVELVKAAAKRVAAGITEGLTLTLEINSPSKVAYEIGQFVAAGLTEGLRAGEGMTWSMARAFGKGTANALEEGLGDFDSVSQHAINMVTMDLLDENRFNMPDFSFINRFGNEDIDFDKMREFLTKNFSGVFDQDAINNFVGSYRQAMKEVKQTINDEDYNSLMVDIAEGDYGFGHDAIIKSLTEELGTVEAANQAWEDYTDVLSGNLKINQDLLKQRKQNPPMTEEQWMAMLAWDQEGFEKANKGEFLKLAEQNGTTWQEEAAKGGWDPKHIQDRFNKSWQNSEQYYDLYIKQKAENEILEEQTRLVDEVIEASQNEQKAVHETANTVYELNDSFEASRNGRNYFVDEADGLVEETEAEQKAIRATQKAIDDLNESRDAIRSGEEIFLDEADGILIEREGALRGRDALQEFRNAVEETTAAAEEKNDALTEEGKELDNVAESAQNAAEATENATTASKKYTEQVDYNVWASGLQKVMKGTDDLTEAEKKMLDIGRQAIYEGSYGKDNTNRTWEKALVNKGLSEAQAEAAAQYAAFGGTLENYKYVAGTYGKAMNDITTSTQKTADAAEEAHGFLDSIQDDTIRAYGQLFKYAMGSEDAFNGFEVDFNYDKALENAKKAGDETAVTLIESIEDKAKDLDINLDLESALKEGGITSIGEFIGKGLNDLVAENLLKNILPEDSLGQFGFLSEITDKFGFSTDEITKALSTGLNLSGKDDFVFGLLNGLVGIKDAQKEINETEITPEVNTSPVEAALSMADQLKEKYTLTGYETDIAKQGAQNLQNGVALTEKQADILQKIWDGTMIGMYESGDKRVRQLKQLFDIDWDTLSSFSDGFGNLDLSTATSSAQEFADTVINMEKEGEKYSTEQLFKDIQEGKWGVGEDRVKALEKAGYNVEKVQEKFLQWHGGDSKVAELPDDYLKISEAEKNAAEQAEKMNAVLNQTPEGAFRSVADFLDGVNKAVENSETADKFKQLMTDIADSMKSLSLSDASNFEKVAGFLTAVRTSAKESSVIAQDFKAFVDGIKDSIIKLGDIDIKNPEGMEKVKNFLNSIKIENKDTLDSVSSFIGNIVEFATGANAGGDYSTKLVESIDSLMTSINGIELNPDATTPVVEFLDQLTNAAGILSGSSEGVVQTFISNIYSALENTTDKAASAADTIAQVIVDTLASYYPQLATIGHNFVWWLARGILKARNLATDAGESVAGALMNSLKDYAVSKAQKSGGDFVSNFVTGMNSPESQKLLQRSLDNLFNPKTEAEDLPSGADALAEKLAMKNGKEAPESEKTETQKETGPSAGTKYGQQFVQDMSAVIQQGAGTVGQTLSTLGETLSASISIDTESVSSQASNFMANLASGLEAGFAANTEQISGVTSEVNATIAGSVPDGYSMGMNFMMNLARGLADGAEKYGLGSFVAGQNLGKTVEKGFTSEEEINSPSRVFARFGMYIVQGLANGISDSANIAGNSVENMGDMISSMFTDTISNISDMTSDELNLNPVIRPVIDMSDVYDSASTIDAMLSSDKAMSISAAENAKNIQSADDMPEVTPGTQVFNQYNYSPKALSRLEIYRQTRNQFAMIKGVNQLV